MTAATIERRTFKTTVELRNQGDKRTITGLAPVFNRYSQNLGGFVEVVDPGACDVTLGESDIRGLFNHDSSLVLGRNRNPLGGDPTMVLTKTEEGVRFDIDPPDTTAGRDLVTSLERGDVDGASHSFRVVPGGVEWGFTEDDFPKRTILAMQLYDVGPVTFPAFLDSAAAARQQRSIIFGSLATELERPLEEVLEAADAGELRSLMTDTNETEERLRETRRSDDDWARRARLELEGLRHTHL